MSHRPIHVADVKLCRFEDQNAEDAQRVEGKRKPKGRALRRGSSSRSVCGTSVKSVDLCGCRRRSRGRCPGARGQEDAAGKFACCGRPVAKVP